MSNRNRAKGTGAETNVEDYLNDRGHLAFRRAQAGALDKGDIVVPGPKVCVEVKNCARLELSAWVGEATVEAVNAGEDVGVVWHKRRGKGSPADWYVTMTGAGFVALLDKTTR